MCSSSLAQSGCPRLSPIHSSLHGHQSTDNVPVFQIDSECFMLATSRVVLRSAELSSGFLD